jgi:predicted DNA-binding protein (MmcQ/YjbR family)
MSALDRIRRVVASLDGTTETVSHGEPTFWAKKRTFAVFASAHNHHGNGRNAVWCKSTIPTQSLLVGQHPDRIFVPPYVGPSGWIGVWLHGRVDWAMVRDLLTSAHELAGVKKRPPRR